MKRNDLILVLAVVWVSLLIVLLLLSTMIQYVAHADTLSDSPVWMFNTCGDTSYTTVGWYNPPDDVLPFDPNFPAFLTVLWDSGSDTRVMSYYGSSSCPLYPGCIVYRWRTSYLLPDDPYTLDAYVLNVERDSFYVEPRNFDPGCVTTSPDLFLPVLVR